jgi:subtilisin
MSLGGSGISQAQYDAIQGAVDAGVAFAVAAGNSDADANNYSPAAFDNVLTVSALADFNGMPGGGAASTCRTDQDDTLADFSNWGTAIDIAAPGVCILSTYPLEKGEYGTISGTSMASPHAAGALALLASSNNPGNATDVRALYDQVKGAGNYNWVDDSGDKIHEPLLDVSNTTLFSPVLVPIGGGGGEEPNQPPTASFTYSCTLMECDFDASGSQDSDGSITAYAWTFGDGNSGTGVTTSHNYTVVGTHTVSLTVTDNDSATDVETKDVAVSDSTTVTTLSGSSTSQGSTWTAIATYTGKKGTYSGTWSNGATGSGSCTIGSDGESCSVVKSGIAKRTSSVTYTDGTVGETLGSVTITKP